MRRPSPWDKVAGTQRRKGAGKAPGNAYVCTSIVHTYVCTADVALGCTTTYTKKLVGGHVRPPRAPEKGASRIEGNKEIDLARVLRAYCTEPQNIHKMINLNPPGRDYMLLHTYNIQKWHWRGAHAGGNAGKELFFFFLLACVLYG